MNKLLKWYVKFKTDMRGASAVEYGILVALIAAAIITTVVTLGTQIDAAFTKVTAELGPHVGTP
jgi:pilus assembly protein Flp/PilA